MNSSSILVGNLISWINATKLSYGLRGEYEYDFWKTIIVIIK